MLGELFLDPEPVATDTKKGQPYSGVQHPERPLVHSPFTTVDRKPEVVLVEVSQDVLWILVLHPRLIGAE